MAEPMVPYVKLPSFEECQEMFKDYFDLKREDGILQVTMKTGDKPMHWSGGAHRAMSQLSRMISLDHDNEIIIWTHKGDNWMQDYDYDGWQRYSDERFQHQYFDDMNLIKNMIFDLDVPTIGAIPGPGFHWDSAILCDITVAAPDCTFEDPHLDLGMVSGDGMGMLLQHLIGTKKASYLMYLGGQINAQTACEWGLISEIAPKGQVVERAWEIARIIKEAPYEARTITSYLAKRPLEKLIASDMKMNSFAEMFSTMCQINKGSLGNDDDEQVDEKYMTPYWSWRCDDASNDELQKPRKLEQFKNARKTAKKWFDETYPNAKY